MTLAEQLKRERVAMLNSKYSNLLDDAVRTFRSGKGVYEFECPNDCDATANNVYDFFVSQGFSVRRVLWKPWHSGSYTKRIEVRL